MNFMLTFLNLFFLQFKISAGSICPIENDPLNLARCIQVDIASILYAVKNAKDFTPVCLLADRYMECIKTYSRGCIGYYFGEGALTELQNVALYCCNGLNASDQCIFNPNVAHSCIDSKARVKMWNGSLKTIQSLQIGDQVKTLNDKYELIDTSVIMFMDTSSEKSLFVKISTKSNRIIKVSHLHLVAVVSGGFKRANKLKSGQLIPIYDYLKEQYINDEIKSVEMELVNGFSAPLTTAGTILVEGILVSCYAVIESHRLAHLSMSPIRWLYALNSNQFLPDYIKSIIQINKQSNGIHWYPHVLHTFFYQSNLLAYL